MSFNYTNFILQNEPEKIFLSIGLEINAQLQFLILVMVIGLRGVQFGLLS